MSGHAPRAAPARGGPIDDRTWPDTLDARVVRPGPEPLLHGYDLEGDLARHYSFGEVVLLALGGEPPDRARGGAFEAAMIFAAGGWAGDAPSHAALLARLGGARPAGVLAVGAVALTEQARARVAEHEAWLGWLDGTVGEAPAAFAATTDAERAATTRLAAAVAARGLRVPELDGAPAPWAAVLAVLHRCGLRRPDQLEAALVVARLAVVAAEAHAAPAGDLAGYPLDLPPFRYAGRDGDAGADGDIEPPVGRGPEVP